MKKLISVVSALAMTAAMAVPFSAFAEETAPAHVEQLVWDDSWTYENFFEKTGSKSMTYEELPEKIESQTKYTYVIYRIENNILKIAGYLDGKLNNTFSDILDSNEFQWEVKDNASFYYFPDNADNTITQDNVKDSTKNPAKTDVEYVVDAAYTVTIPASVTLSGTEATIKQVKAENVRLASDENVVVKLTKAFYAADDNEIDAAPDKVFSAKTADKASTATYIINNGKTGIGDTVATFATQAEEQTTDMVFSKAEGATFAGTHTEILTFTISVEDAVQTKKVTIADTEYEYTEGMTWAEFAETQGWTVTPDYIESGYGVLYSSGIVSPSAVIDNSITYSWAK